MPRTPQAQRTERICLRLHISEADALRAGAIAAGMGFSEYLRVVLSSRQLPSIPSPPATPYPVVQGLHAVDGQVEVALQRINGFYGWLATDKRQRLAKASMVDLLERIRADLAHAKAMTQACVVQVRVGG